MSHKKLSATCVVMMQQGILVSGPRQANLVLIACATAKVQASLRIRAVSPEPPLLAHTGSESRGAFRQKARSLAPLNGWVCAVKICHDGMLEDTNSLDVSHLIVLLASDSADIDTSWSVLLQLDNGKFVSVADTSIHVFIINQF